MCIVPLPHRFLPLVFDLLGKLNAGTKADTGEALRVRQDLLNQDPFLLLLSTWTATAAPRVWSDHHHRVDTPIGLEDAAAEHAARQSADILRYLCRSARYIGRGTRVLCIVFFFVCTRMFFVGSAVVVILYGLLIFHP